MRPQSPFGALAAISLLSLAALSGCGSLPRIVPDMARGSGAPVRLEGARGPLSAGESKAILERLASRGDETGIFERHLALEESVSGTPLVVGNKVILLQDGPATYRAMFQAIAAARDHVHLETYIIEDDEVGRRFAAALVEKQSQGVQVRLIYDSVGASSTPPAFFKHLTDNGVAVLEFNPVNPLALRKGWEVNQRDHRKLLVVDGRVAFMGGINISSVYSAGSFSNRSKRRPGGGAQWRDTHLQVEGPVVAEFQKLFLATWEKQKGDVAAPREHFPVAVARGREVVRAIGSSPDEASSQIYATLLSAIGASETAVHLTNAYFVPDPQLLAALKDAAARGVDVRLILPGHSDSWLVFHAGRAHYGDLLRGGVKIHERRHALLHSKTAVIDGVWSTVGSTNLDWRSFLHNDEVNAVVLGADFAAQMKEAFARDLAVSDPITLEGWQRRSIAARLKQGLARLWEYWL